MTIYKSYHFFSLSVLNVTAIISLPHSQRCSGVTLSIANGLQLLPAYKRNYLGHIYCNKLTLFNKFCIDEI